jgi:hypothetical protein
MRIAAISIIAVALALPGCGGSGGDTTGTTATGSPGRSTGASDTQALGKLPPGAVAPTDTAEQAAEGPAATEASPEAQAEGPKSSGELSGGNRSAVTAAVTDYIAALDHHDAGRVCGLFVPGGLDLGLLPAQRGGCRSSLRASIGTRPRFGGPAWRKTSLVEVKTEDLGDERARVSATVTHHFSDRKYVSVEDDDIYLERVGGRWMIAKASGTLYRAVGYESPPLEAFRPPPGWH